MGRISADRFPLSFGHHRTYGETQRLDDALSEIAANKRRVAVMMNGGVVMVCAWDKDSGQPRGLQLIQRDVEFMCSLSRAKKPLVVPSIQTFKYLARFGIVTMERDKDSHKRRWRAGRRIYRAEMTKKGRSISKDLLRISSVLRLGVPVEPREEWP